ncbi:MAG: hypothetical protein J7500_12140 [Sphingomonas sp.]|uniref:hypothetical protein n=1 Tax=Sphingomonas sp. TaxID=28214 RepID=UPI001B1BFBB6|nr:hypothetical protein [Sphingomonas sp.]MBO9623451.1 hypothetical protein [Sphingomonas sp.]
MANNNSTSQGGSPNQNQEAGRPFIASAQETLGGAFNATVGAAKEHPVAAAAIAAGAAAAVGGAVYAATQLRGNDSGSSSSKSSSKK